MNNYHKLLEEILESGERSPDRTGVGTISVFGRQLRFNLEEGFPAITTKKLAWNAVKGELLWFLEGSDNERRLAEITHGTSYGTTTIWTPNAMASYWQPKAEFEGDLGRVYGVQWRRWRKIVENNDGMDITSGSGAPVLQVAEIDQITTLIEGIRRDPHGRRHILTAWNPGELDDMALPPCHVLSQFSVKSGKLSCQMYQRSADMFLGVPFNIASYSLLTHMIAHVCVLGVGEFIHVLGDAHIYLDHLPQVQEQLSRTPYTLPKLWLNPQVRDIDKFTMADIQLEGYQSHGAIRAPMAV